MPLMRTTWFFNAGAQGWTENFHHLADNYLQVVTALQNVAPLRRAMLSNEMRLQGVRISDDDIPGDSVFVIDGVQGAGTWSGTSDPVFSALLVRLNAGALHRRNLYMSGIPDDQVVSGAKVFTAPYLAKVRAFLDSLPVNNFGLRTLLESGNPWLNVLAVSDAGVVTTTTVHGYSAGQLVHFRRLKVTPKMPYRAMVGPTPGSLSFTVAPWAPRPAVIFGGQVKRISYVVLPIGGAIIESIVKKSRGRAFFVPRGRRRVVA